MQILTRQVSRGARDAAFLTSCRVMPTRLVPGPHTERPAWVFLPQSSRDPCRGWVFGLLRSSFSIRLALPGPLSVHLSFLSAFEIHVAPFASCENR